MNEKIKRTIENLEKNNMRAYFVKNKDDVVLKIKEIIKKGATVSVGGSMTLFETGVIDHLKGGGYTFLDRYKEGITAKEIDLVFKESFKADAYLSGTNAITESGELYNVDGNANRISAIAFGAKKVIIVAGKNKIVSDIDEAIKRVKTVAAPKNCVRLNKNTYCAKMGYCQDMDGGIGKGCSSNERICRHYLVSSRQPENDRIYVIIVDENLGY